MDHIERRSLTGRLQFIVAQERSKTFRWTFAFSLFAAAFGVRLLIDSRLPPGFPYLTFFPAVIVATLVSGLWPGIVCAALGGIASWYFFIAPVNSFELTPGAVLALAFYTFIVAVDILIIHTISVTTRTLVRQRQALAQLAASREKENIQLLEQDVLQKQLSAELVHRLKNQLTLVQAIVNQTTRSGGEPEAMYTVLRARIGVLAGAHELLVHGVAGVASVADLVSKAISIYDTCQFDVGGPDVKVAERAAVSLSLMLHELGTNAAKYGALSVTSGRVHIGWSIEGDEKPVFKLIWKEEGGPPVSAPKRRGAGSRLISVGIGSGSDVTLSFDPAGLECQLTVPLDQLQM
ncbi:two-component sensor histidine kinase [Rhizobium aquaticum]|uniref:histidine kinase n=1 Tax=Rhizobium aquaticum TaxID=1549636 RepID=A0ABV2ITX8_9HYPH